MVTGGSCGARPPSCSVVRVAPARRCRFAGAGPAAVPLTTLPSLLGGGLPPGPGGAEGRACGSPAGVGAGGGGWGGRPSACSRACVGGGGGSGGRPLVPWRRLLTAGGGAAWQSWPRGPAFGWGVAPFPRPPLPRDGSSCRHSLGPLIPRPLSRGAGRPGVAVRVSGQWLAGCGAAGSPPALVVSALPPAGGGTPSCVLPHHGGGVDRGAQPPPPTLSRIRPLGHHLRRRLCGGWGCGGGGLCPR